MVKKALLFITIILCITTDLCAQENPATEVRAVWLTTNWNLDWPNPRQSVESQKKNLRDILNKLQVTNINTVFFQTRIRGDVFHDSDIEPTSPFANKSYDALKFAVEECHKRGIECHAWVVTFPLGTKNQVAAHGKNAVVNKMKSLCKFHQGEWYLDPGNPEARKYIVSLVNEIVKKYDIDGIHFDYIRYPEKPDKFPDKDTYQKYGGGMSLQNWRRNNINILVSNIYDAVKKQKPWVQVSSSPIGKYKNLNYDRGGWTAYESVSQDAAFWLESGKHDALYPMMYYKDNDFYPYLDDWMKNSNGRLIVPGLGVYQMLPSERNWDLKTITSQIDYIRKKGIKGEAFFRAGNILNDIKGVYAELRDSYYQYPAKLPPMSWLNNEAPNSPINLQVSANANGQLIMQWQPADTSEEQTYTIYWSDDENVDVNNPKNILATGIRGTQMVFDIIHGNFGLYYSVTASDRFHNESVPCFPAFVSHLESEK